MNREILFYVVIFDFCIFELDFIKELYVNKIYFKVVCRVDFVCGIGVGRCWIV